MKTALLFSIPVLLLAQDTPPKPISPIYMSAISEIHAQARALQAQAEVVRLKVCSEAGIVHTDCIVSWELGTVQSKSKPPLPNPEPKKPEEKPTPQVP